MNWMKFNTYNESKEKAFEILSNQIFKYYCEQNYKDELKAFVTINGDGGDGGIEAYAELKNGEIIAIQSKCFFDAINGNKITQIENSIKTALKVRNNIRKYIVSVPRNLSNKKNNTENPEREKIQNVFKEYNNIEFEIWDEFKISSFLTTESDLAGVYRFWFENSEIDFNVIKNLFEIQKNGWLKDRYNKNLHVKTSINYEIEKMIGNLENRKEHIKETQQIQKIYQEYIEIFEKFVQIIKLDVEKKKLKEVYKTEKMEIEEINIFLEDLKEYLKNENYKIEFKKINIINIGWFYELNDEYNMSLLYSKMKNVVEKIQRINFDIDKFVYKIENEYKITNLIIKGDLGTGKTHSIANQVENEINNNNIAILIRASEIENKSTWKEILTKTLRISNTFSEIELFNALESLSYRNEFIKKDDTIKINKKILICVDGIDEHSDYDYWAEKQKEAIFLAQKYKKLRFCFSGRKYCFVNLEKEENSKILDYTTKSGYNVDELYKKYIDEYKIEIDNSINIKQYLDTPLTLKMFSEQYQNKKIDSLNGIKVSLSSLFEFKLQRMDKEIVKRYPGIICKNPISKTAKIIIDLLYKEEKIKKVNFIKIMNDDEELSCISNENKNYIIEALEKYGLLQKVVKNEGFCEQTEWIYIGIQPVVDYIMARNLSKDIHNKEIITLDNSRKKRNIAMLCFTAVILFENYNILFWDLNYLGLNRYTLNKLTYYAIVNSNPTKSIGLKDKIKEIMLKSPNSMRECLNDIVIPCSKVSGHPLGAEFLDNILRKYKNIADRDKMWSLPQNLNRIGINIIENLIIDESNSRYYLDKNDQNNGLPIIYAWLLSSTDNNKLYFYRNQLTDWALKNSNEFVLLLNRFSEVNDVQIVEQIYGIAMCLCYKTSDCQVVNKIFQICKNVFFENDIIKTYDFQIRTYIRAIAEKCYKLKFLTKKELKNYLPPYKCKKEIVLHKDAAENASRMGGYKIIDYDLARYVLCDYLQYRFFDHFYDYEKERTEKSLDEIFSKEELIKYKENFKENKEYNAVLHKEQPKLKFNFLNDLDNEISESDFLVESNFESVSNINYNDRSRKSKTEKFLNKEGKKIKIKDLTYIQFILSAAYQYILNCGWSEEIFYEIDNEIRYHYYPASHGTKSTVMCLAEKYIWCFRNEIIGYLADNLYRNKKETQKYTNYEEIDDVLIPISEYETSQEKEIEFSNDFLPEPMLEELNFENINEIKEWIQSNEININLEKWIRIKTDKNYLTLKSFNSFNNIKSNVEVNMWIEALIINENDMQYLKDNIRNNQLYLWKNIMNNSFKERTYTDGPKSPLELINFGWYNREDSIFQNISLLNNIINRYNLYTTYEETYKSHTELVEIHYSIPSFEIRKLLKIDSNEEFKYKSKGEIVSFFSTTKDFWEDSHNILLVTEKIEKKLKNKKIIWTFRIEKSMNTFGRELYKEAYDRNDIVGICFMENDEFKYYYFDQNNNIYS